jgi:hypothetical protein
MNILRPSSCGKYLLHDRPNSPENQFARCLLLILGVKLTTLSLSVSTSPSFSGVRGTGTDWPRGLVGVIRALILSLLRRLIDLAVQLASVGVGVVFSVGVVDAARVEGGCVVGSTTLMVAPNVLEKAVIG